MLCGVSHMAGTGGFLSAHALVALLLAFFMLLHEYQNLQ